MSEGSVITDDMRAMIGTETSRVVHEVDKTMLSRIAEAIGDADPRWQQEAAPGFVLAAMVTGGGELPDKLFPMQRRVAGGGDWEFLLPIRVGDVITCSTKLADIYEREGKAGKLLFIQAETMITNQRGELAARGKSSLINY